MMLSVLQFLELELVMTGCYLILKFVNKLSDEYDYHQEPDLHQLTNPKEDPQLQALAHLLIQFKDELSFQNGNQFNRMKLISGNDTQPSSIARMRFWSKQDEFIILLSENILTAKLPKTEVRALCAVAISHLVCGHYKRRHEALMLIKEMTPRWIVSTLFINVLCIDKEQPYYQLHAAGLALVLLSAVLMKSLSVYFKNMEKKADVYAIDHFGVRQDDLSRALSQVGGQSGSGFFSSTHSNQERQTYLKKMS